MSTPSIRHKARIAAQRLAEQQRVQLAEQQQDTLEAVASDYQAHQTLLQTLEQDLKKLHNLPSIPDKIEYKQDKLIPFYQPIIDAYRTACDNGQPPYSNQVLVQLVIWLFDVGDIAAALNWGRYAVAQKQPMPERFKRDLPTYVVDATRQWAELQREQDRAVQPYVSDTLEFALAEQWPVNGIALCNLHKLAGDLAVEAGQLETARDHFLQAKALNPHKAQVTTKLNRINKALAKAKPDNNQPEPTDDTATDQPEADAHAVPAD
jgi:tetratricopeptide (TPR) repeat protein